MKKPKLLFLDIETAPIVANVWGIHDQEIGLNMIKSDWHVLSWAAKWQGKKNVMYLDQRNEKDIKNDKCILVAIWKLLDEADIIVTQNGTNFDAKKLNTRFILNGIRPPRPYEHIDTLKLARKNFAFTSNRLEFLTDKLNKKYKKLKHKRFPGFDLWRECMDGNKAAWKEMERYNKHDVLALEELYDNLIRWHSPVNFSSYTDGVDVCSCGSESFAKDGTMIRKSAKYQRYRCKSCGSIYRGKTNLLTKSTLRPV